MFRQRVTSKFTFKISNNNLFSNGSKSKNSKSKNRLVEIIKLPPSILARLPKEVLEKLKFFKKSVSTVKPNNNPSYTQALNIKVNDILKLKEDYSNLLAKKIKNIHKIINNSGKSKSGINIQRSIEKANHHLYE